MNREYPFGPKSKWQHQAIAIAAGEITLPNESIPMLLKWLKDYNWPGAKEISDYLFDLGNLVVPYVRDVLRSSDQLWIYWVLSSLVDRWPKEFCTQIVEILSDLAFKYDEEGNHIIALTILLKYDLVSKELALPYLQIMKIEHLEFEEDYSEIESELLRD